ncbi:hypothetical protein CUU66_20880 [Peribacillus deserti]|uniref:Uncharacterized protein n=1 Tax=Peribacillus deserti TaxID=673318 RepID=A0A2N5M0V8_9BACI|nr:hypothetical protein CUU66_20880 [Peribacillus deserti]
MIKFLPFMLRFGKFMLKFRRFMLMATLLMLILLNLCFSLFVYADPISFMLNSLGMSKRSQQTLRGSFFIPSR